MINFVRPIEYKSCPSGGSGNDKILTGQGDDQLTGGGRADILVCGPGEDTVTDYNPDEGDIVTPDWENVY